MTKDTELSISERISARIKALGKTQTQISTEIGISKNAMSNYVNGNRVPDTMTCLKLAKALGVTMEFLLTGETNLIKKNTTIENKLSDLEHYLLENFRELPHEQKKKLVNTTTAALIALDQDTIYPEVLQKPKPKNSPKIPSKTYQEEYAEELIEPIVRPIILHNESAAAGVGNYLSYSGYETLDIPESQVPPRADCLIKIEGDSMEPDYPDGSIVWVEEMHQVPNGQVGIFIVNDKSFCKKIEIDHDKRTLSLHSFNTDYEPIKIKPHTEDQEGDNFKTFGKVLEIYK